MSRKAAETSNAGPLPDNGSYLDLTAIVSRNGRSKFECWRIAKPFTTSSDGGITGAKTLAFSSTGQAIYTVIPPRFDGGLHNAPVPQLVAILSGMLEIILPDSDEEPLRINGGSNTLLLAMDTEGAGHITRYPTYQQTVAIQIPFADGVAPEHTVVHEGPCR